MKSSSTRKGIEPYQDTAPPGISRPEEPQSQVAAPPDGGSGTAAEPKAEDAQRLMQALWPSENRVHLAAYRNRAGNFRNVPVASAAKACADAVKASASLKFRAYRAEFPC